MVEEENLKTSSHTGDKIKLYLKKGGKQWRSKIHFSGLNNTAYGALNQIVKKNWLKQQVNSAPKWYTENENLTDQFVDPKARKRVSASPQPGAVFIQKVQPPPNNMQSGKAGGYDNLKAETGKLSNKKGREASSGGKKKTCYHCRSDEHLLIKFPQISRKQKKERWKQVLQQHQHQQVQSG